MGTDVSETRGASASAGLNVCHSNRLERLFQVLRSTLAHAPADPLTNDIVVVPHPAMGRWLAINLARERGICANIAFPLPATFIWQVISATLPEVSERAELDRDALVWRTARALQELQSLDAFAEPARYFQDDPDGRKRLQLATRCADRFDEYQVFRRDWITAWRAGGEDHWQALLWRRIVADLDDTRDRTALVQAFLQISTPPPGVLAALPHTVSLFGVTQLPPDTLLVLERLSAWCRVDLYMLNPCLQYWGDIESEQRTARRRNRWRRQGRVDVSEYYSAGNPLLAAWGVAGRDTFDALTGMQAMDHDAFEPIAADTLLHHVQNDILELRTPDKGQRTCIEKTDRSIQVHACHGEMREVEVLHDQLLHAFNADPGLTPADVLVMAPDIGRYGPAIEAVFGGQDGTCRIPWALADCDIAAENPVIASVLLILKLPESRCSASEILELLEVDAIARAFALDADAVDELRALVAESGVRWGFDARHRQRFEVPGEHRNTWAFGLDRMLMGYAMPEQSGVSLGVLPVANIEGDTAQSLGGLARFVESLHEIVGELEKPRGAPQWCEFIGQILDRLYAPVDDEVNALDTVRATLAKLVGDCQRAQFEDAISLAALRDWLDNHLFADSESPELFSGAVTFCQMVPMRSVPMPWICLLGMNDQDFPRRQPPDDIDLMRLQPRAGDRDRRNDDRYLFLEAFISARDTLYLSYVGRALRDETVRLPAIVVSELLDYVDDFYQCVRSGAAPSPVSEVVTRVHTMQPFSAANFASDATRSFAADWCRVARRLADATREEPELGAAPRDTGISREPVILANLIESLLNPSRFFLRRLGVSLGNRSPVLDDEDPVAVGTLDRYQIIEALVTAGLAGSTPAVLDGALASGHFPGHGLGEIFARNLQAAATDLACKVNPFVAGALQEARIDLPFGDWRLSGVLTGLAPQGRIQFRPAAADGRDYLRLWVNHLVLRILAPDGIAPISRHIGIKDKNPCALEFVPDPVRKIEEIYSLSRRSVDSLLPFMPRSSFAYASVLRSKDHAAAEAEAQKIWLGSPFARGESQDPYFAFAFRGCDPIGVDFFTLARQVFEPVLDAIDDAG